jgi:hypothetical protein
MYLPVDGRAPQYDRTLTRHHLKCGEDEVASKDEGRQYKQKRQKSSVRSTIRREQDRDAGDPEHQASHRDVMARPPTSNCRRMLLSI